MKKILCFGEVLWDMLPSGKKPGGAPMNVAFHANNFGMHSSLISSVGNDDLSKELLDFFAAKNVDTSLIQINQEFPTSTVQVQLDEKGHAAYEIVQPVAWDFIRLTTEALEAVKQCDAFIFGSLALRSEMSRKSLEEYIKHAKLKVLDVNLRAPHYAKSLVDWLFTQANIVKLNDEELELIGSWFTNAKGLEDKANALTDIYHWQSLIVTQGGDGAFVVEKGKVYQHGGITIQVEDTVGSGDSFLAAFLAHKLQGLETQTCLKYACATGAFVATQKGGTPVFNKQDIEHFLTSKR
jgi:fructokinase